MHHPTSLLSVASALLVSVCAGVAACGDGASDAGTADREVDGGSDAGLEVSFGVPPDGDPDGDIEGFDEEEQSDLCEDYCDTLEGCGVADGSADGCQATCRSDIDAEPAALARVQCGSGAECDSLELCLDEIPIVPGCQDVCRLGGECGVLDDFNLPSGQEACAALCSGSVVGDETESGELLTCLVDALEVCDVVAVQECGGEDFNCEAACSDVEFCDEGDEMRGVFATSEECIAHCEGLSLGGQVALGTCLDAAACDINRCDDVSNQIEDGCEAACDVAVGACGDPHNQIENALCPQVCTGLILAGYPTDLTQVEGCVAELDSCPVFNAAHEPGSLDEAPQGEPTYGGALALCALDASKDCRDICGEFVECESDADFLIECHAGCTEAEDESPELVGQVADCLRNIPETMVDVCQAREACLPEVEEDE